LCAAASALVEDGLLRADIARLRGRIEVNVGSAVTAHRIFTEAAERVAPLDPARAVEMAVAAAVAENHGVDSGARLGDDTIDVTPAAADSARIRCLKQLLTSTRHDIEGNRVAAIEELKAAVATALEFPDSRVDLDLLGNLGNAALHLGHDELHHRLYSLMLSTARENGDGMAILYALQRLSFSQYTAANWVGLRNSSEEALALAAGLGQKALTAGCAAWLVLLSALQGRPDLTERLTAQEALLAAQPPVGIFAHAVEDLTRWAKGVRASLDGSPGDALLQFRQMQLPTLASMAAQDCMEVAVRAGEPVAAAQVVERLDALATTTGLAWARAAAASGRALIAAHDDSPDADRVGKLFEESLRHHSRANRPFERARVQLAYGQFMRRCQRRLEARVHLRAAFATFEDLRADPFTDRAAEELRATGETARKRDPSTLTDLTPMERRIVELVSQGLSNKDVAAQCWVSPRTVAFHLRNVFTKLGISSRGELSQLNLG
jgi:DNA-binding CsgD family transcriptional regulator